MAANPNINDQGAPTGGRGIENISNLTSKFQEASSLIDEVNDTSKVMRSGVRNSQYESKNFHIDAMVIGNKIYPYKIELQKSNGNKNTVAVCIAAPSASAADIRAALHASLGNQHTWSAE
jgi:hypothetical protein